MNEEALLHLIFPDLRPFYYADGDGGWLLLEDFSVEYIVDGKLYKLTVKKGYDYDGASIPRLCRSLVGDKMAHDVIVGALFHDILYCIHHPLFPRKESDKLICHFIGKYNGTKVKQDAVYVALRSFGGHAWSDEEIPELSKTIRYREYFEIQEV